MSNTDNLHGIFAGLVEKTEDPEKLGRLKVRVPSVYGADGGQGSFIGVDNLPWALPAGLPAGGSPLSGGMDWLPAPGDQVFVMFLDGEPEKPVWMWAMQTRSQTKKFPLHSYGKLSGPVGKPDRGALTRYGHTVEWGPGTLIVTTSKGYRLSLSENALLTGQCLLTTPKGNQLSLDDSTGTGSISVNLDMMINAMSQFSVLANSIDLTAMGGGINVFTPTDVALEGGVQVAITAPTILVGDATTALLDIMSGGVVYSNGAGVTFSGLLGNAGISAATQATLNGNVVAIGNSSTELLRTIAELVYALGLLTVPVPGITTGLQATITVPLMLSPGWPLVAAALARLESITGVMPPDSV